METSIDFDMNPHAHWEKVEASMKSKVYVLYCQILLCVEVTLFLIFLHENFKIPLIYAPLTNSIIRVVKFSVKKFVKIQNWSRGKKCFWSSLGITLILLICGLIIILYRISDYSYKHQFGKYKSLVVNNQLYVRYFFQHL